MTTPKELTYPEELLLTGVDQYLLYGRRNAFSYSTEVILDDGTQTKFANYVFPRSSHAGRYIMELVTNDVVKFDVRETSEQLPEIYQFLTPDFFLQYCGKLAAIDEHCVRMSAVHGVHVVYTDKTVVLFNLATRALLDVSGVYTALPGGTLN